MRLLKVHEKATGLLSPYHQHVLSLVEDSGSEGITVDNSILNGFDPAKILETSRQLQQTESVCPRNEISEQGWYPLEEVA